MADWVMQVKPGEPAYIDCEIPEEAEGAGLSEAPRGALGHWIRIKNHRIENYQLVVPTTWNASPKDANGNPGPMEQAIIGTKVKDENNPYELVRIIRSFDPCLACSVHAVDGRGRKIAECRAS
jgi:hydrogenase large subunit